MLIPIEKKTIINKKIQFTNVPYRSITNYIRVLSNINNQGEVYMLLSTNYYDGPDKYNVLYGSEIHIKIFLNTFNDLP